MNELVNRAKKGDPDAFTELMQSQMQNMYKADDGNTEVFYFKDATAIFSSFTDEPETVKF